MIYPKRSERRHRVGFVAMSLWLLLALLVRYPTVSAEELNSIAILERMGEAFSSVAEKASPAVVGIRAEWTIREPAGEAPRRFEDFFDFFFRRPGPQQQQEAPPRERRRRAQGSGFIISQDGHILTNSHMVDRAERVEVQLRNGQTLQAQVVGTDPESDVAVVKVDAADLATIDLADSDALRVGEWVLAIGSPLGLAHTVTAGIVSATGRRGLRIASYENFIQTDAAINIGNSGGPLIDLRGRAVGINTAIAAPGGGNIGIGFAIPINMARDIADQLIQTGTVERGYLGVLPQEVTGEIAEALGFDEARGVVIPEVTEGAAGEKAGLRRNDVILELDGVPVDSVTQFRDLVAERNPGTTVSLLIVRDGTRQTLEATLDRRPPVARMREEVEEPPEPDGVEELGLVVRNLTPDLARQFGHEGRTGVIVARVITGSEAARRGIRPGFLIEQVDRQEVQNVEQFAQAVRASLADGRVVFLVRDGQASQYVVLNVSEPN